MTQWIKAAVIFEWLHKPGGRQLQCDCRGQESSLGWKAGVSSWTLCALVCVTVNSLQEQQLSLCAEGLQSVSSV